MIEKYQKIEGYIKRFDRILIICHRRPDEDTLGSALALSLYLRGLGKQVRIFASDAPPPYLSFLPGILEVSTDRNLAKQAWDAYLFIDCGSISNTGLSPDDFKNKRIINIDHHISNSAYGEVNLILPKASSACEVVYDYFIAVGYPIDKRIATCLLAGIMGDTSCFIHSTTGASTIKIASELIKTGVHIHQIFDYVVRNKTIGGLRLWGEALSRLKINQDLNIAYTWIHDHDFDDFNVKESELDGLANFLSALIDVSATAVFRISKGVLKASWRTKRNDVDLSKFCGLFGGGGHRKASGFTLNVNVEECDGNLVIM